ncbi:MAG: DNA-directed RNA polymerase subunit omega [Cyanobacteria bacterium NC_groundwater_1444_Ag_S-0.65um_54_12]|nr:DNA-directed RNA polymerase subunit omega [Cyanobacteria bacterium NC_groundwater_1444_Ag_S-0.65um_54_12]
MVDNRTFSVIDHSELLLRCPNKYELVLKIAKRAKILKDEIARAPNNETLKPIPLAITEILSNYRGNND